MVRAAAWVLRLVYLVGNGLPNLEGDVPNVEVDVAVVVLAMGAGWRQEPVYVRFNRTADNVPGKEVVYGVVIPEPVRESQSEDQTVSMALYPQRDAVVGPCLTGGEREWAEMKR